MNARAVRGSGWLLGAMLVVASQPVGAQQTGGGATSVPAKSGALPKAPYVRPAVGMTYRYTSFTNTITRNTGWQTWYTDQRKLPGLRVGLFISDDPKQPAMFDSTALERLWPLSKGRSVDILMRRISGTAQMWRIVVSDTETVTVPAGRFFTYRVDVTQTSTVIHKDQKPVVSLTTFWYAPAIAAVARVKFAGLEGPMAGKMVKNELISVTRP